MKYQSMLKKLRDDCELGARRVDGKHPTTAYFIWNEIDDCLYRIGTNGTHNREAKIKSDGQNAEWFTFKVPKYKIIKKSRS